MKKIGLMLVALLSFSSLFFSTVELQGSKVYTQEEIETVNEAGTYPVRLYVKDAEGKPVESTFNVTLTFPNTVTSKANGEGIDASDFEVKKGELEELTDQGLIERANAKAWSLGDGSPIPIVQVIRSGTDVHSISFLTEKGTTVAVQGIVSSTGSLFSDESFMYLHMGTSGSGWEDFSFFYLTFVIIILLVCPILLISILFFLLQRKINRAKGLLFSKENRGK